MVDEGEHRLALSCDLTPSLSPSVSFTNTQIHTPALIPLIDKNVTISWSGKKKNLNTVFDLQNSRNCGGAFQLTPWTKRRSRSTWKNKAFPLCKKQDQRKWSVSPACFSFQLPKLKIDVHTPDVFLQKWMHYVTLHLHWLGFALPAVTRSKEEKTSWAEEETLQDPQQPFGRCAGGLFRWCSCEEVKSFSSPVSDLESVNKKRLELQTPATRRYTDYVLSNDKTTSFPFLAPLIDHVLHGVASNCIVDSFHVCLLSSENWGTLEEKSPETIMGHGTAPEASS